MKDLLSDPNNLLYLGIVLMSIGFPIVLVKYYTSKIDNFTLKLDTFMQQIQMNFDRPAPKKVIDFKNIVHGNENNRHSQQILEDQYTRLNKNCKKLYEALKSGGWWSGKRIIAELDMLEYRRRILDLKEAGIEIKERLVAKGCKEWSL